MYRWRGPTTSSAPLATLTRRATYGGRKGRRAQRRIRKHGACFMFPGGYVQMTLGPA